MVTMGAYIQEVTSGLLRGPICSNPYDHLPQTRASTRGVSNCNSFGWPAGCQYLHLEAKNSGWHNARL